MSYSTPCYYRFGHFCVDPDKLVLTRNGSTVALPPKTFETLLILIQHRQAVIEKDDLIKLLWPETFVQEINLTVHISRLRKVLGEDPADHKYIVTVPRRGYRFVAAVDEVYPQDESSKDVPLAPDSSGTSVESTSEDDFDGVTIRPESKPSTADGASTEVLRPRTAVLARLVSHAKLLSLAAAALVVLVSVYAFVHRGDRSTSSIMYRQIAVLPFQFMGAPEEEYLAAGMAATLSTRLSRLRGLTLKQTGLLTDRSGPDRPGQVKDPLAVGRDLNVDAVLDGTLRQSVEGLLLTTRLLRVKDGTCLWVGSFEVKPLTVMDVQDSICRQLSTSLGLAVEETNRGSLTNDGTRNAAAYEDYLRGLHFWNTRSNDGLKKAIEYFTTAIGQDADFAPAYAALADCYHMRAYYNFMTFREAYPLEKAAATRALELDDTLAQAHMAMAEVLMSYEHDPEAGAKELRRALELDPSYATAHQRYAWMLVGQGKLDEGLAEMKRAVDLEPLSVINNSALATLLYFNGQNDAALEKCHKALELDPDSCLALQTLGWVHLQQGLYDEALPELERAERNDREAVDGLGTLGNAYAVAGKTAMARKYIEKLERMSRTWDNPLYGIALIYAGTGDRETGLAWLERAARSDGLPEYYPRFDPRLAPLRADRRFENIVRIVERPRQPKGPDDF